MAPPVPKDDEVLLKVHAASVNALDWRLLAGRPVFLRFLIGGMRRPKSGRPGRDVAGVVEAVGKHVTRFAPGDEVFGACPGAFAEYACAQQDKIAAKPASVSFEDAAATPVAGLTALQGLRDKGRIAAGQKVLVDGASGGVGTFAVQIAKAFGAEVTAVCSTRNVEQARALGADHVIDHTREPLDRDGTRYDLVLAANSHRSIFDYRRVLAPQGVYVMAGGGWTPILQGFLVAPLLSRSGGQRFGNVMAKLVVADLEALAGMLAAGTVKPAIERRFPLRDTAEGIRYAAEGHARGKLVITVP